MVPRFLTRGQPVSLLFGVMVISIVLMLPVTVSAAATHPKTVDGYVRDVEGNFLVGVTVHVTIDGNLKTATTDATGFYTVNFPKNQWTVGSRIYVNVTYNSNLETAVATADDSTPQRIDVQFTYEIPQFEGYFQILLAAGILGVISVVFLVGRRRSTLSASASERIPREKQ